MANAVYFDIAAIILSALIIASLIVRKLTKGITNTLFIILVIIVWLSAILDCVTVLYGPVLPANQYTVPDQTILNYLYFIIRNATMPFFIVYVSSVIGMWHKFSENKKNLMALFLPYGIDVLFLIINIFTGCIFKFDTNGIYERGSHIYVLYLVALYYSIFSTVILIKNSKFLNRIELIILTSFIPISAGSVLTQFINPEIRIEIVSTAILLILVALAVQRPEENLDRLVNTQSYNAFIDFATKSYGTKRPLSLGIIKIANQKQLRNNIGFDSYNLMLRFVSDTISRISKVLSIYTDIYYLDMATFAIAVKPKKFDLLKDMSRLLSAYLSDRVMLKDLEINIDARIVIANIPDDIPDVETLLNFTSNFDTIIPSSSKAVLLSDYVNLREYQLKQNIDSIINRAIKEDNLHMYYQPIYSVKDKKFVSCEALIRLTDPEYGFVSPGLFIPAAEQSGAIHKIGDFVFEDVCRFISNNDMKSIDMHYVEINLSVAQCIDPNLVEKINRIMDKYNLPRETINIEITETAVDYNEAITSDNIEKLHDAGYSFSLDDYGTGYSNIKRLSTMPLDLVKLDKSFVDEMSDPDMYKVIVNTVQMLKKLNKKILVEGVETEESFNTFVDLECDYIQGFLFSKPLPPDEFITFVKEKNK